MRRIPSACYTYRMHNAYDTRADVAAQPDRDVHARYHASIYERSDGVDAAWGGREPFDSLVDVELAGDEEPAL